MSEDNAYALRQAQRDAQHAEDYRRWVDTLPEAERAQLRSLGIDRPDINYHGSNSLLDRDLAESSLASEEMETPVIESQNSPKESLVDSEVDERVMDVLRRLLGEVLTQKNARLTLECLAMACGFTTLEGESMTSLAARHGVSRAAVSKRCVDIGQKLNLPPSRTMRSQTAKRVYRKIQKTLRTSYERNRNSGQ